MPRQVLQALAEVCAASLDGLNSHSLWEPRHNSPPPPPFLPSQDKEARRLREEQVRVLKAEQANSSAAARAELVNEAYSNLNIRTEDGALRHRFAATDTLAQVRERAHSQRAPLARDPEPCILHLRRSVNGSSSSKTRTSLRRRPRTC